MIPPPCVAWISSDSRSPPNVSTPTPNFSGASLSTGRISTFAGSRSPSLFHRVRQSWACSKMLRAFSTVSRRLALSSSMAFCR